MAILLYLQRFVDAGFDLGIGIREVAARQDRLGGFIGPVLALRLAIAALMIAVAILAVVLVPTLETRLVALYAVTLIPLAIGTRWVLTGMGMTRPVGVSRALGEAVVLTVVAIAVSGAGALWRVPVAQLIGDTVSAFMLLVLLRRLHIPARPTWNTDAVRPLVRHVAPYVGSALLGLVIFNADLIFLRAFRDRGTVGLYASAYALVSFLINVGATYGLSLIPSLTRLRGGRADRRELYATSWARAVAVVAPVAVGGAMIASELLAMVFGVEFRAAGTALAILLVSVPLSVLRSLATSALTAEGREDLLFRTVLVAAVFNVGLNLAAVPAFGMVGAAAVTVATELLRLVLAQRYAHSLGISAPGARRHVSALIASAVMAGALSLGITTNPIGAILVGALVYGVSLFALGGLARDAGGRLQLRV